MKKFSVILLIAVLAIGCVFAETAEATVGITGKATATYTVNFDEGTAGFDDNGAAAIYATMDVTGATKATEGTGLWGEIVAELKFTVNKATPARKYAVHSDDTAIVLTPALSLKTLKLHWNDAFVVDLTTAKAVGDFAKSALDYVEVDRLANAEDATETEYDYYYSNSIKLAENKAGVTFDWNGFSFAGAANCDWKKKTGNFYLGTQTPEFAFGAFTMQGAGGFQYTREAGPKDAWTVAGSLKFGATTDVVKVNVATDQALRLGKYYADPTTGKKATYNTDIAVNAVFGEAFATLDAYYSNDASAYDTVAKAVVGTAKNLLSAQVAFDLNEFNAPLTFNVAALDILNAAELDIDAELTLAGVHTLDVYAYDLLGKAGFRQIGVASELVFEPVTIDLGVVAGIPGFMGATSDVNSEYVGYTASVEYINKYFTVKGGVKNYFGYKAETSDLRLSASIEADKTVFANTKLSVAYSSKNVLGTKAPKTTNAGFGKLTASCAISF